MGEELWEEYKEKLLEVNDKWNYIDALIYRYRSPENLPITMWSKKLDENPNYWEEYIKELSENLIDADRKIPEYSELKDSTNAIEFNIEEELEKVKLWWERKFIRGLFQIDKDNWKYLADSKPKLVTDSKIIISISKYNLKRVHQDLGMNLDEFQSKILPILQKLMKDIKSLSGKPYAIELRIDLSKSGFHFDELVANPQIFYPFNASKEEAAWEYQKQGLAKSLEIINERIAGYRRKYLISKEKERDLSIKDIGDWYGLRYELIKKLLENKFDDIPDLGESVLTSYSEKPIYCRWVKIRKVLGTKYCGNRIDEWDIFCQHHILEKDEVSQNIRQESINQDIRLYPSSDRSLIEMKFSYPTTEIIELRKRINTLSTNYYLYLYPKLIERENLRVERWKLQNIFFDTLKPLYEKYYYSKFGRPAISMSQKLRIMKKTDFKCAICKADLTEKEPHIDHIIPLSKGGGNSEANLQALCWQCNLSKGAKIL